MATFKDTLPPEGEADVTETSVTRLKLGDEDIIRFEGGVLSYHRGTWSYGDNEHDYFELEGEVTWANLAQLPPDLREVIEVPD